MRAIFGLKEATDPKHRIEHSLNDCDFDWDAGGYRHGEANTVAE